MNCANHSDRERVAFCQNCGKPLCQECVRNYGTAILCEQCLALRTATGPAYGPPPVGGPIPPLGVPRSAPNPGLAALLGLIPGVGAMYNEQYAKGVVHLIVFVILVSLSSDVNGVFGLLVAGWIFYMAIEAHHTARAKREGTPLPNPFGLNDIGERFGFGRAWPSSPGPTPPAVGYYPTGEPQPYTNPYAPPASSWGAPQETYGPQAGYGPQAAYVPPQGFVPPPPEPVAAPLVDPSLPMYKRIPTGAIWLIGLGVFFLLSNVGLHIISGRLLVPFLLIGIGVYTFVNKMTNTGHGLENDGTDFYRWRLANALHGATWLVLVGVVMLLHELHILPWGSSWPIFLIAAGILLMLRHSLMSNYPQIPPYPPQGPQTPPAPPVTPAASTEIVPKPRTGADNQEGR
jgi:hypothetical protein